MCYNSSGYDDRSFDEFDDSSSDSGFEKSFERSFEYQHAARRLNFEQSVVGGAIPGAGGCAPLGDLQKPVNEFAPVLSSQTLTPAKLEPKPKRKYAVGKNRMTRTRSPEQVNN